MGVGSEAVELKDEEEEGDMRMEVQPGESVLLWRKPPCHHTPS